MVGEYLWTVMYRFQYGDVYAGFATHSIAVVRTDRNGMTQMIPVQATTISNSRPSDATKKTMSQVIYLQTA